MALPMAAEVKVTQGSGRISIVIDGKPYTDMFYGPETNKPYLHPLRSASGKIVTRHYPMEPGEGESKDHPHQRGLWFTHGDVNGYDFWANEESQKNPKKGKVVIKEMGALKSGDNDGSLQATFNWLDPAGQPLLTESRQIVFYSDPENRVIDFDLTLRAIEKVTFGDTKEGTFAMRLAAGLEEPEKKSLPSPKRTGVMVNSRGGKTEKQCWGERASWMDYAGELEGEKLGIAILDNPGNPRHPTYWHSRSYGLFAANIFGLHDFLSDKTANGSLTLQPGESLRFRYRVIVHPGDYKTAKIAEAYQQYAGSAQPSSGQ